MPIYDIAGLRVKIENCKSRTLKQAAPYLSKNQQSEKVDITINITPERVEQAKAAHPELNSDDWEYMLSGSDFYTALLDFDGILLHSSCVVADGVAYAFSADSGTGKSTHTQLWLKHLGNRAHMLNDDKPAIRCINGKIYACGTPWSGKYDYSTPEIAPLGAICFLERSTENRIKKADSKKAIYSIFSQTLRKLSAQEMNKLFDVLEKLFKSIPLYEFGCDISENAFKLSYNTIKKELKELE